MSLKQKTVSGVVWTGAAKMGMQVVLLVVSVVLARLLSPQAFAIVGMAALVTVAVSLVNDKCLGMVLVQRPALSQLAVSSLFFRAALFSRFCFSDCPYRFQVFWPSFSMNRCSKP